MRPILCLADDLTGAASIASGLGELGAPRRVTFEAPQPPWEGAIVVDLRVRDAPAAEVRSRVAAALGRAHPERGAIVSLRVDSTGLSPLDEMIEAAFEHLGDEARAFVVPVHPPARRRFVNGTLWAGDEALEWRPVGEVVTLEVVRSAPLAEAVEVGSSGGRVLVFEGETEEDLDRVARVVIDMTGPVVAVDPGPFTLALHLAGRPVPRVLAIMGSTSSLSAVQVAEARRRMGLVVVELEINEASSDGEAWQRALGQVVAALEAGRSVCVVTSGSASRREAAEVAGLLGQTAADAVASGAVDALYVSGGHVAEAVCSALGVRALAGLREIDVLASCGWIEGGAAAGLPLALKGGQIGHSGTMVRMLERLQSLASRRRAP